MQTNTLFSEPYWIKSSEIIDEEIEISIFEKKLESNSGFGFTNYNLRSLRKEDVYIKPDYKIAIRFLDQVRKYLLRGMPVGQAIKDYSAYRFYNREMKSHYEVGKPWIVHQAYERLNQLMKPGMKVLEFGMGGSTVFFREKEAEVYSIEHHEGWYQKVKKELFHDSNVHLTLVKPELNQPEMDDRYKSVNGLKSEGMSWKAYAHAADHFEDDFFDVLLIDGRARPACLEQSISKLKPKGILIFDNSERESYQKVISSLLQGWKRETYTGVTVYDWAFNQTSLFFKP